MRFLVIQKGGMKRSFAGMMIALVVMGSVLGGGMFAQPKQAEAIPVTEVGANLVKSAITAAESLVQIGILSSLNIKEITFDGIAWSLAKKVLSQMVRSTIDWVNSGFNGKPAFITNYADYFLEAADQVAIDFLADENFDQLCQPLQVPIQIILDLSYRKARNWETQSQCTVSGNSGSMERFLSSGFNEGGWPMWFKIVSEPQNNIYGAAALSRARMDDAIAAEQENKRTEAVANKGYKSVTVCENGRCDIVLPGDAIAAQLNFALQIPGLTLIEADEINELIGALMAQLGQQALSGAGGLLGLSSSSGGSPSYLDMMELESELTGFTGSSKFLDDAIRDEENYLAIHEKALDDLQDAAADASCSAGANVLADILELAEDYADEVDSTMSVIEVLLLLKDTFDNTTDGEIQAVVVEEFQRLQSDGFLHSSGVTAGKTFEIAEAVTALQDRAENVCN